MPFETIRRHITGFVRAFRTGAGPRPGRHRGHAIARTFKDGTTLSGGNSIMGAGNVGSTRRENLMAEAADRYDASFTED